MKETIEKLFFAIARILFFLVALGGFLVLIGSGVYLAKLYLDSLPKHVRQSSYLPKDPNVTFDLFETYADQQLAQIKNRRERIRQYVKTVVKNGSSGHGYGIKNMPGNLIPPEDADRVALYIANGLRDTPPRAFRACSACHGENGRGQNGKAPDLHTLPILTGVRGIQDEKKNHPDNRTQYTEAERSAYEKSLDRIVLLLNRYASKTRQSGAKREVIDRYLRQQLSLYDGNQKELFFQQLESGLEHLDGYAEKYLSLTKQTSVIIEPVIWQDYLKWFAQKFKEQIEEEKAKKAQIEAENNQRIHEAKLKEAQAREKIAYYLTIAGGALVVFLLATMLLVLIRIEYNTRNRDEEDLSE